MGEKLKDHFDGGNFSPEICSVFPTLPKPIIPVGGVRVGQRMVRRPLEPPKGTWKVESVKAALPHPDSVFLSLALFVWECAFGRGHAARIKCLQSAGRRKSRNSPVWFENKTQKGLF